MLSRHNRLGITLTELLIVIAIIGILVGITVPAIQRVRLSAKRLESSNNLRQLAIAANTYNDVAKFLPRYLGWNNRTDKEFENGINGTAFFHMLPFLDHKEVHDYFYGPLLYVGQEKRDALPNEKFDESKTYDWYGNNPLLASHGDNYWGTGKLYKAVPVGVNATRANAITGEFRKYYGGQIANSDGYLNGYTFWAQNVKPLGLSDFKGENFWYCVQADAYLLAQGSNQTPVKLYGRPWQANADVNYEFQGGSKFRIKTFVSPLDITNTKFRTTSYLANRSLLSRTLSVETVPGGASQTVLFSEGWANCDSDVLDIEPAQSKSASPTTYGSRKNISRSNDWLLGTQQVDIIIQDIYGYTFKAKIVDTLAPRDLVSDKQFSAKVQTNVAYREYPSRDQNPPYSQKWWDEEFVTGKFDQECLMKGEGPALNVGVGKVKFGTAVGTQVYNPATGTYDTIPTEVISAEASDPPTFQYGKNIRCIWSVPQTFGGSTYLNVAMVDGSVRQISSGISYESWNAALTPESDLIRADFFE